MLATILKSIRDAIKSMICEVYEMSSWWKLLTHIWKLLMLLVLCSDVLPDISLQAKRRKAAV